MFVLFVFNHHLLRFHLSCFEFNIVFRDLYPSLHPQLKESAEFVAKRLKPPGKQPRRQSQQNIVVDITPSQEDAEESQRAEQEGGEAPLRVPSEPVLPLRPSSPPVELKKDDLLAHLKALRKFGEQVNFVGMKCKLYSIFFPNYCHASKRV